MLPKKHRLMLRHFPDFFPSAKKLHSPLFSIFYISNETDLCQVAVIVPKKNVALSTGRNKIKRLVSDALLPYCLSHSNLAIAIVVKKNLEPSDLVSLKQLLERL